MQDVRTAAAEAKQRPGSGIVTDATRREIAEAALTSELLTKMDDHFRQLAARCFDEARGEAQVLAVSSPTRGSGTSAVVVGLAHAAARNLGSDVLIVETDLKNPTLARDLGTQASIGLSDYLARDADLEAIVAPTSSPRVWLLPAGRQEPNPGPLVRSEKFARLLGALRSAGSAPGTPTFRAIVLDTPPLLTSPDSNVITQLADGLVLVARAGETHANDVRGALKIAGEDRVHGIVLNRTRSWVPDWMSRLFGLSRFDFE